MANRLTRFNKPMIRYLPALKTVLRFDSTGVTIRAYRCRKCKSFTWEQIASLADDSMPFIKACETGKAPRFSKNSEQAISSNEIEGVP